jgi:hypothetical protein
LPGFRKGIAGQNLAEFLLVQISDAPSLRHDTWSNGTVRPDHDNISSATAAEISHIMSFVMGSPAELPDMIHANVLNSQVPQKAYRFLQLVSGMIKNDETDSEIEAAQERRLNIANDSREAAILCRYLIENFRIN